MKKVLFVVLIIVALTPVFISSTSTQALGMELLQPPTWHHPFGTDQFGRDVFLRTLTGGRTLVLVSLATTVLSIVLGSAVSLIILSKARTLAMRMIDVWLSFPSHITALLVLVALGRGLVSLLIAVTLVLIPRVARVLYPMVLSLENQLYIHASYSMGARKNHIVWHHIIPNLFGLITVEFGIRFVHAMLLIAGLNFLGLGVQPPTADWGLMIAEGRNYLLVAPWVVLFPSVAISLLTIVVNLAIDEQKNKPEAKPHKTLLERVIRLLAIAVKKTKHSKEER